MASVERPIDTTFNAPRSVGPVPDDRAELVERGRWAEADEVVMAALHETLSETAKTLRRDINGLVYVAGGPRVSGELSECRSLLPPERRIAMHAIQLANKTTDRRAVVELAHKALSSPRWREAGTLWFAALALAYAGEIRAAESYVRNVVIRAGWVTLPGHVETFAILRARLATLAGRPTEALQLLEEPLVNRAVEHLSELAVAWMIEALLELGKLDEARNLLHERGFDRERAEVDDTPEMRAARGALHLADGRPQLAYEDFMTTGRQLSRLGVINPAIIPWRSRATFAASRIGRRTLGSILAGEELVEANRWGTPLTKGTALGAVASVSEPPEDVVLLEQAAGMLAQQGPSAELLRVQLELGARLEIRGSHREARKALESARGTACQLGNEAWSHRLNAHLMERSTTGNIRQLSHRELEVAIMARSGYTNRQIATRLGLTASTIEFHLSNAYRKLGLRDRRGLVSAVLPQL
ncbi:helix-turn-helix transcriptional regulator [Amycolatopsis sp. lyj-90]|uniref:helix-turn-helix transcriptional regulator n=1 Tax=Amycolatopsis sp. lyj-90 TaxID=2789285 RepID=UPI00397CD52D